MLVNEYIWTAGDLVKWGCPIFQCMTGAYAAAGLYPWLYLLDMRRLEPTG